MDLIVAIGLVILFKLDSNHGFFSRCDLEIWWTTSKSNRAPHLYYIKLCALFQIHQWIQTGATVRKRSIRDKVGDFLSSVALKFDGWPCKIIGYLFYTISSFGHHFKAIRLVIVELQSGNAQFGSKSNFFLSCVTLKFDGWPWEEKKNTKKQVTSSVVRWALPIISKPSVNSNLSCSPEILNLGQNRGFFFVPCDLEIWWMALKNNRTPLLYYIKLCASFQSHLWILTGVTVRKRSIWVKIGIFFRVTLKFDGRPWKQ